MNPARTFLFLCLMAATLSACGVKRPLRLPGEKNDTPQSEAVRELQRQSETRRY